MDHLVRLTPTDPAFPAQWQMVGRHPLTALGNLALLQQPAIALFCSQQYPPALHPLLESLASALQFTPSGIISGFHTPPEKACLAALLTGSATVIHCPARSLDAMRLAPHQQTALQAGRLLFLSPFPASQKRATTALAEQRNQLVAAIAQALLIVYATPGGKTAQLAQAWLKVGKPVYALASPHNQPLVAWGAQAIAPGDIPAITSPPTPE